MKVNAVRVFLIALLISSPALADSSSPNLAAYYDRQMAIVGGQIYAWKGRNPPKAISVTAHQVGVGRDRYYALTNNDDLLSFAENMDQHAVVMQGVARFSAGDSGVLAITNDRALWWLSGKTRQFIANNVAVAAVGDSANYYITSSGDLFVKGRAHRGQYGDGQLRSTDQFVQTASNAAHITAHTGHAILLLANGDVLGTGGNIYGPVGIHGLGDKAVRWSQIMSGAKAIATGSSHSLAIRPDGTLVAWGRGYDPEPMPILGDVVAVAAGSRTTIALKSDDTLWQWNRGQDPQRVRLTNGN
jgi:alpha-tubulin suppressor-like RCC1 family protein